MLYSVTLTYLVITSHDQYIKMIFSDLNFKTVTFTTGK